MYGNNLRLNKNYEQVLMVFIYVLIGEAIKDSKFGFPTNVIIVAAILPWRMGLNIFGRNRSDAI
jgi:hypothetical protein